MPNLQGPVTRVLSFLPANVLVSSNTDPNLLGALGYSVNNQQPFISISSSVGATQQQVLGYTLAFTTTSSNGTNIY